MSGDLSTRNETAAQAAPTPTSAITESGCPLDWPAQRRNLVLFALCTGMQYLAAPVLYVGVTQASLCNGLGAKAATANLPATAFFAFTATPVFIAWAFPFVVYLKRVLVICYASTAVMLGVVALTLPLPIDNRWKIGVVVLQGAVSGAMIPTAIAFLWEVVGRGSAESRRGLALSLAFGFGPMLAVVGSLASQLLLDGKLSGIDVWTPRFPQNFIAVFAWGVPAMAVAAILSSQFVVPLPEREAEREPLIEGVFGGLWDFLTDRVLLTATVVTVLVYCGNTIASNMNLYTPEVLREPPESYAGYQNALRFGFKVAAGFLLGWLLTRTDPKSGLLVTATLYVAAQVWAMTATGTLYLLAFGIYGAGELVGVYSPNYILSASRKSQIRRNMAFATLMMAPAAPTGYLFGKIKDRVADIYGARLGFQISFAACAGLMIAGILLAVFLLPARPTPRAEEQRA